MSRAATLLIEFRWGDGRSDRLPELATELVRANVDVLVVNGEPGIRAARQATATIPIVMGGAGDPVSAGFAESLARPGGNITGVSNLAVELTGKWFQLLREAVPRVGHVAVLWNPTNPTHPSFWREAAAQTMGVRVSRIDLTSPDDLEKDFARMAVEQVDGVVDLPDPLTGANRSKIAQLLVVGRLPAVAMWRESAEAGLPLFYGVEIFESLRRVAGYLDRIFKGAKPAEMPIEQGTRFDLVVNLRPRSSSIL
jgi:putative tryptophan/tyrosine transport system substrate-binding protein